MGGIVELYAHPTISGSDGICMADEEARGARGEFKRSDPRSMSTGDDHAGRKIDTGLQKQYWRYCYRRRDKCEDR